ncbi:hypothetical protein AC579_7596 [Pseudocercospora musae]|uniref:Uncharacterized protein n=1 Tax=Pseudocercospora musae TaxID=113226 RepID=A0A139H3N6_9PEZI|nr:hypothetical protein AC579_7596 [Pseudocercospora musae]
MNQFLNQTMRNSDLGQSSATKWTRNRYRDACDFSRFFVDEVEPYEVRCGDIGALARHEVGEAGQMKVLVALVTFHWMIEVFGSSRVRLIKANTAGRESERRRRNSIAYRHTMMKEEAPRDPHHHHGFTKHQSVVANVACKRDPDLLEALVQLPKWQVGVETGQGQEDIAFERLVNVHAGARAIAARAAVEANRKQLRHRLRM